MSTGKNRQAIRRSSAALRERVKAQGGAEISFLAPAAVVRWIDAYRAGRSRAAAVMDLLQVSAAARAPIPRPPRQDPQD